MRYEPMHEVTDQAKVDAIAESMRTNGWQGAPLVTWGDCLITGVHRSAAAARVGVDIETVDLEDVYAEAGLDFATVHAAHGAPTLDEWSSVEAMLRELPVEVRERYGIEAGQ